VLKEAVMAAVVERINITVENGVVKCVPQNVVLTSGQSVQWTSPSPIVIDFGEDTPFEQGSKFGNNVPATVANNAKAKLYECTITVNSVTVSKNKCGVEVRHPDSEP
jgi:hypothetical protein